MRMSVAEFTRLMSGAARRLPGAVARAERESLADHVNAARTAFLEHNPAVG